MSKRDWSEGFKIWYDSKYDIHQMSEEEYLKLSDSFGAGWHLREEESREKRVALIEEWKKSPIKGGKKKRNASDYIGKTLISCKDGLSIWLPNIETREQKFEVVAAHGEMNTIIHVGTGIKFQYPDDFLVADFEIAEREK